MSRLAINETFLSAFGITLPSNCGGKKNKPTDQVEAEPELRLGRGRAESGRLDREAAESLGAGREAPPL